MRNAHPGAVAPPSRPSKFVAPPRFNHVGPSFTRCVSQSTSNPWGARSKEDITVCGPMWDRGEPVAPTKKPSQSCSLAAALGATATKAKQSKQKTRKADLRTCPICQEDFTAFTIEAHASNCKGPSRAAVQSLQPLVEESSEEEELDRRWCKAVAREKGQAPEDEGTSSSEDLRYNGTADPALVRPGGYCIALGNYDPTHECQEVQMKLQKGQEVFVDWKEESGHWAWIAHQAENAERCEWGYVPINCLGPTEEREAGSSNDWVNFLPASVPAEKSASESEEEEPQQAGFSLGSSDSIPEEWLETFLMLNLPEELAIEFWSSFENSQKEVSLEAAWLQAIETACSKLSEAEGAGQRHSRQAQEKQEPEAVVPEAPMQVMTVRQTWQPSGEGSDIQLRISVGDRLIITWQQPEEEGAFWAYGYPEGQSEHQAGYFPMKNLGGSSEALRPASNPTDSIPAKQDTTDACSGQTSSGAGAREGLEEAGNKTASARAAGSWRSSRRRQATSTGQMADTGSQPKLQPQLQAPEQAQLLPFERSSLEEPWETAPQLTKLGRGQCKDTILSSCTTEVSKDTQKWAEQKVGDLCRRFCISKLDTTVAVGALCVCTTAAEMRSEAILLIADNQLVKNFAAEFWKRRCTSSGSV